MDNKNCSVSDECQILRPQGGHHQSLRLLLVSSLFSDIPFYGMLWLRLVSNFPFSSTTSFLLLLALALPSSAYAQAVPVKYPGSWHS